jgi:exopolysaccharide biosynthesis protein
MLSIAAMFACTSASLAQTLPQSINWEPLGADLERAQFSFSVGAVFTSSIVLVRSDLDRYKVRAIRATEFGWKRATIRALCRVSGATVCINANFFDEQGKPLGLVVSRGIMYQKIHRGGGTLTGVLVATAKQTKILHRDSFSAQGVIEGVQAGPRLISSGQPVKGLHDASLSSNLSGACLDKDNRFILYRVTSGVFGATIRQLQEVLLHPSIGCTEAINFDGGGSSQMYVNDEIPGNPEHTSEEFYSGLDSVPVAIGLFDTAR